MHGLGTIVNCSTIIIGAAIGLLIKGGLAKRYEETIFSAVGLAVIFIGLGGALAGFLVINNGALATQYTMMMVLSLVLGAVTGELLDIEKRLDKLGEWIKSKMPEKLASIPLWTVLLPLRCFSVSEQWQSSVHLRTV